jgi:hypothetical protein
MLLVSSEGSLGGLVRHKKSTLVEEVVDILSGRREGEKEENKMTRKNEETEKEVRRGGKREGEYHLSKRLGVDRSDKEPRAEGQPTAIKSLVRKEGRPERLRA